MSCHISNGCSQGKYQCTIDLLFDWFGISSLTTDIFCFYLQKRLIQTSQIGGQWSSDTSPFCIPWCNIPMRLLRPVNSFAVSGNLWPILLSKILFLKFSQTCNKKFLKFWGVQICAYFSSSFSGCWFLVILWFFTK